MGDTELSIPFGAYRVIVDDHLEQVALRDAEPLVRARQQKQALTSALEQHPDLAAALKKALRDPEVIARAQRNQAPPLGGEIVHSTPEGETIVAPAFPGRRRHPLFLVGEPAPLERTGSERIMMANWKNPRPSRALTPTELERYWQRTLEERAECAQRLATHTDGDPIEHHASRRRRKERAIRISMMESVLELLHRIVAPAARYLCGADCPHLGQGLDVSQLKRFLDSLDLYMALNDYETEEYLSVQIARGWVHGLLVGEKISGRR